MKDASISRSGLLLLRRSGTHLRSEPSVRSRSPGFLRTKPTAPMGYDAGTIGPDGSAFSSCVVAS